ncbi:MAG: hypothetical protein WAP35_07880 [Solirubrobacterales bacterium]
MTDRDRKLLLVLMAVVVLGGYWFLILGSKRQAVADAETAKTSAQAELEQAIATEKAGQAEKKKYPVSYSRVVKLGKAIPKDADYAGLVLQVNDITDETDVRFISLTATEGVAGSGPSAPAGKVSSCDPTGAAGAAPPLAGATSATGATGATEAQSAVGQQVNDANAGAATANSAAAKSDQQSADPEDCLEAPTLTDLAAASAGLKVSTYEFRFKGSFFKLHKVFNRLLGMTKRANGKVRVTGRLLQINTINFDAGSFPDLDATVQMTGYSLPAGTSLTAGATAVAPAGTPAPAAATTPAPAQ